MTGSAAACKVGMPLYLLLPLCALGSTFVCTGGWRTGLRATLMGGSLLFGVWTAKKLCSSDAGWKNRTACLALLGILTGLLAALIIWSLELSIGSPDLTNNPYNQDTKNLFFVCPLYGFFMLGCFGLAFNLPRMRRYFIVLAGAGLANTFGLVDLAAPNLDLGTYILVILRNCAIYYIPCLGNCVWFVLLWHSCAERLCKLPIEKKSIGKLIGTIILGGFVAYFLFMMIGVMSAGIKLERYIAHHKDTVFKDKLSGIIVVPYRSDYYDCQKKSFCKIPKNTEINKEYNSNNKFLRVIDNNSNIEVRKLENDKVVKTISHPKGYGTAIVVNDTVYYKREQKLFRLNPPDYDKPEIILKKFYRYRFYVSPDEKFIAYYGGVSGPIGRSILCIMNLKSKKMLPLRVSAYHGAIFWVNNINELKMPKVKKTEIKK